MDRLIVLDRGKVVEEGDHRSLLASGGLYARLWEHQCGGFLGDEAEDSAEAAPAAAAAATEIGDDDARQREPAHAGHDRPAGSEPIPS